jgi:5-methylthioadenosine/S-adenosylhomocysteine deaminase
MGAVSSFLVHDAAIVTSDDAGTIIDRGWVYAADDRIVEVGSGDVPRGRLTADVVVDGTNMAVMPGMVNGHTHLFQTFFRGLGDDKSLLDWLRDYIWPTASEMTAAEVGLAATVGLIENLRSGATSVIDHQYIHADPATDDAVCAAADRLGVRFLLARGWADRNYEPRLSETAAQVVERTDAVAGRWHGYDRGRLRVETAPLIPWGCSDETMRAARLAASAFGGALHVHCAETAVEVEMSQTERGMRHVPWLDSVGALGPTTQLAHSVWLDDDELALIAERGAIVVHCPVSNMYLASGVPRIPEMIRRGIVVALASDGPGSNNRQDMFEAMKTAVLLQKVHHLDPMILQPEDALRMATRGGAAAFGQVGDIGQIVEGRKADLVIVDLDSPFIAPVHRVASALVFNASPRDVHTVVVDGRVVIRDRQVLVVDERAVLAEARRVCADLFDRVSGR